MGTFHDTKDPLHGITVIAETAGTVYVGRCHSRDAAEIELLDVDLHEEGQDDKTHAQWLDRAARFGVWTKHDRLVLPAGDVTSLRPLSDHVRAPGAAPVAAPAAAVAATTEKPAPESGGNAPVTLTDAARAEVARLIAAEDKPGTGLRLAVAGGGCSGLVYKVEFDTPTDNDVRFGVDDFEVVMDRKSSIYLRDVILDYQGGLGGRGFQFQNPNASNTCGCGESFSL